MTTKRLCLRPMMRAIPGLVLAASLAACASGSKPPPRLGSAATPPAAAVTGSRSPAATSAVLPLATGMDAFAARMALAAEARHTIDLQYYIWHHDQTGKLLAGALVAAAERGVKVRLLLDDMGTPVKDRTLLVLHSHPNLEVRLFNPVPLRNAPLLGTLLNFKQANRRMHNKSFTVDGKVTIVGGRNIGDEYFGAAARMNFADFDVAAKGPVVQDAARAFELYWNHPAAVPVRQVSRAKIPSGALQDLLASPRLTEDSPYAAAVRSSPFAEARRGDRVFYAGTAVMVSDDPDKILFHPRDSSTHLAPQLRKVVDRTEKELMVVSPYFIPGKSGVAWCRDLEQRGVKVEVITNSLASTDVAAVHAGYARYRKPLLASGVDLYETKPTRSARPEDLSGSPAAFQPPGSSKAGLHAKTFVFDQRWVFVGSMNLDPRSIKLNTETGLLIDSPDLARIMTARMADHLPETAWQVSQRPGGLAWTTVDQGQTVRRIVEPPAGLRKQLMWRICSLLPLEGQL